MSMHKCRLARDGSDAPDSGNQFIGLCCLLVLGTSVSLAGCGGSDIETVPVSGRVTLNGDPVESILVSFQPDEGQAGADAVRPGSTGMTDSSGRYELKTPEGNGAVVGKHIVRLVYKDPDWRESDPSWESRADKNPRFKLPPRARDGSITFVVSEQGTSEADFTFESPRS